MDTERHTPQGSYDLAVEQESQAWRELQMHRPGTAARDTAWKAWTDAIWSTNRAWRRLNESRVAHPDRATHPDRVTHSDRVTQTRDLSPEGGPTHAGA